MEMPSTVEWSLHTAFLLGQLAEGETLSGRRIAEFYGLPPAYLSKVLKAMTAAGVLHATTGPSGGYRLARPPEQITALQLVQAIDGTRPAFRCQEIRQRGPVGLPPEKCVKACGIASVMQRAEQAWRAQLAGVSLAELMQQAGPPSRRRARDWLAAGVR